MTYFSLQSSQGYIPDPHLKPILWSAHSKSATNQRSVSESINQSEISFPIERSVSTCYCLGTSPCRQYHRCAPPTPSSVSAATNQRSVLYQTIRCKYLIVSTYQKPVFTCIISGSSSQIITVASLLPVAKYLPFGDHLQYHTSSP